MADQIGAPKGALSLEESARRLGSYVWLNRQLFEVLGGWVASTADPTAQLLLSQHCYQHAWHAELFEARLPRLREFQVSDFILPSNNSAEELIGRLSATTDESVRLAATYRVVLPRVYGLYAHHLASTTPIADAAVARSLKLAMTDVGEQWKVGEQLVQQLLGGSEGLIMATAHASGGMEAIAAKALVAPNWVA